MEITELAGLTERQKEVYELRGEGLSYNEIGKRLGVSKGTAQKAYKSALRRVKVAHESLKASPPTATPEPTPSTPAPNEANEGYVDPLEAAKRARPIEPTPTPSTEATEASPEVPDVPTERPTAGPAVTEDWNSPDFGEDATFIEKLQHPLPPPEAFARGEVRLMGEGSRKVENCDDFDEVEETVCTAFEEFLLTDMPIEQADGDVILVSVKLPQKSRKRLAKSAALPLFRLNRALGKQESALASELLRLGTTGYAIRSEIMKAVATGTADMSARAMTAEEKAEYHAEQEQ